MMATFVVVFRESLEAALIISIVMAASRGLQGRGFWVGAGVLAGLVGAGLLALGAGELSMLFNGTGSDLFNAAILLFAALMLGWHQIWMGTHGKELAGESKAVGDSVRRGIRPISALAAVTAIAVLREGSETVLFLYGIAAEAQSGAAGLLMAGLLGAGAAALFGTALYAGLVRVPLGQIFKVTGAILVLLAAGLAAQSAAFLVQAGLLPPLGYDIWNTSGILPQTAPLGLLLHILIGYMARPEGIQIVFYAVTIGLILLAGRAVQHRQKLRTA